MAKKCPILSTRFFQPTSITVSPKTVIGSLVDYEGDEPTAATDGLAYKITSIGGGTDTINGTVITTLVECIGGGEDGCHMWDNTNNQCGLLSSPKLIELDTQMDHLHDEHAHSETHDHGGTRRPNGPPASAELINEFTGNEDRDGNGAVYGYDFKISDPPSLIASLEDHPDWSDPVDSITWTEYLSWISTGVDPR